MAGIQWVEFEIIESKQPILNHGTFLHGCISSENPEKQTNSIALYYTNESYEVKLCCLLMISIVFWLMNLLLMSMQIHYRRYARRMHDKDKQGFGAVAGKEGEGIEGGMVWYGMRGE